MRGVLGNQHSYRDQLTATNLKKMLMDIDVSEENNGHQKGGRATHSIARFLDHSALLLLLAWNSHAASSRLMKQLAIRLGYQKALHSHSAKSPKDGDVSRWLTIAKYIRKGYAVVVMGLSPNNTRRLVIALHSIPPRRLYNLFIYEP